MASERPRRPSRAKGDANGIDFPGNMTKSCLIYLIRVLADVEMRKRENPAPFTAILLKPLRMENIAELLSDIKSQRK